MECTHEVPIKTQTHTHAYAHTTLTLNKVMDAINNMYNHLKETGVAPLYIEDTNRLKECVRLNG